MVFRGQILFHLCFIFHVLLEAIRKRPYLLTDLKGKSGHHLQKSTESMKT